MSATRNLTPDQAWRVAISQMTEGELLDQIMEQPDLLTDNYYDVIGNAIYDRYRSLRGE